MNLLKTSHTGFVSIYLVCHSIRLAYKKVMTAVLLMLGLCFSMQSSAQEAPGGYNWENLSAFNGMDQAQMKSQWKNWHQEDLIVYPSTESIKARIAKQPKLKAQLPKGMAEAQLAQTLEKAWFAFHKGDFKTAYEISAPLGHFGKIVSIYAAYHNAFYVEADTKKRQALFKMLAKEADDALDIEPKNDNIKLIYCYMQGRYLEELPFKASLITTYSKLFKRLNQLIDNNEKYLGARLILAGFHAEGNAKAGFLSKVRFGSSAKKAAKQYEAALKDDPNSIVGHLNYAMSRKRVNKEDKFDERAIQALNDASNLKAGDANGYLANREAKKHLASLQN